MTTTYSPTGGRFIYIFAGLMIAGVILWYAYRFADGGFLAEQEAQASVLGKEHVPPSEKSMLQNIGGVNQFVKVAIPETWLLNLDIAGKTAQAAVDQEEFRKRMTGESVKVRFKRKRISGNLQVTQYLGKEGG